MNINLNFQDNSIDLESGRISLEYPIADAFWITDKIIVLFKPDAKTAPGQFQNLVAITPNGSYIWRAELPTITSSDAYYRISSRNPLTADSLTSFSVVIDDSIGSIVRKSFYK